MEIIKVAFLPTIQGQNKFQLQKWRCTEAIEHECDNGFEFVHSLDLQLMIKSVNSSVPEISYFKNARKSKVRNTVMGSDCDQAELYENFALKVFP